MGKRWMLSDESRQEALRAIVGLVLFVLVMGIWACLWVPPVGR